MSDLVGNPEDRFSHNEAQFIEAEIFLLPFQTQFSTSLFEDIACMIYDLIDARRQWQNYVENIRLIQVPQFGLPATTAVPGAGRSRL